MHRLAPGKQPGTAASGPAADYTGPDPPHGVIPPTPPGPEGSKGTRALTGVRGVPVTGEDELMAAGASDREGTPPAGGSSLALYRKYRPATFAEVKGQDHVTGPLRQALRTGRINHAYLFSGPRGCGKTSSARILARSLNCVNGPTPDPCGVCESCVALAPNGPACRAGTGHGSIRSRG